jgi:hypothetical protein
MRRVNNFWPKYLLIEMADQLPCCEIAQSLTAFEKESSFVPLVWVSQWDSPNYAPASRHMFPEKNQVVLAT